MRTGDVYPWNCMFACHWDLFHATLFGLPILGVWPPLLARCLLTRCISTYL